MKAVLTFLVVFFLGKPVLAELSDSAFVDTEILEVYLVFNQPDFWQQLQNNYNTQTDIVGSFSCKGVVFDSVGVRLKGNSSYNSYPGVKKSFKIDFNSYNLNQTFFGLKTMNLNNEFKDPTLMREKIFYDFAEKYVPCSRTNYTKLFVNGTYWGLYLNVEQVDKTFLKSRFGSDDDGNLFKGDPQGSLKWKGSDTTSYLTDYELETENTANAWERLVNFIDKLNNTPVSALKDSLEQVFEVQKFLLCEAMNIIFVNLDSYPGTGHNFYLYEHEYGKFDHIFWDTNEAFGNFNFGMNASQLTNLSISYANQNPPNSRPLVQKLLQVPEYQQFYYSILYQLVNNDFTETKLFPEIDSLNVLIQTDVFADTNKMYTNSQFTANQTSNIQVTGGPGGSTILGLKDFVTSRRNSILTQLAQVYTPLTIDSLFVNEFMTSNSATLSDQNGEFDDWVELYNAGSSPINLNGLYLTDDFSSPTKWQFPDTSLDAKSFLIVWTDSDATQTGLHTNFKLSQSGEKIGIFDSNGITPVDTLSFSYVGTDSSFGRVTDGGAIWQIFTAPTPGISNTTTIKIFENTKKLNFKLEQNFPNPFNPTTKISYQLSNNQKAKLTIFNVLGEKVRDFVLEKASGSIVWNGTDFSGKQVSSGIYFYQLQTENFSKTKKMVLLR
ncbi:CotH kinase family protein [bacterium]|nr:CotH kinase family protein [bacterium]